MGNTDSANYRFGGFIAPAYTQVPDAVFDELLPIVSGAELKVLLYVIRRTFGFKKATDNISINQIMRGITTHDGEVLDRGTGLSKDAVTRAVKRLVEIEVLDARRNQSPERGNEPTTYALHVQNPLSDNRTSPSPIIGQALVRLSDTQETVLQETVKQGEFENSNDTEQKLFVDNMGITGYLDHLVVDISREFGDTGHLASNCKQARNIFAAVELTEEQFVEEYVYQARQKTKHQTMIRNKMAYFFQVLREMCGLEEIQEA